MPLPFRNPVGGDGDPPEWQPPDYAKPVASDNEEEWSPPSYAKPVKSVEVPKKNVFARADRINPKDDFIHKGIDSASKFIDEHPNVRQIGQRFLSGSSPEDTAKRKELGYPEPTASGVEEKIPGTEKAASWVRNKGINTGNYWGGVAGSVAGDIVDLAGTLFPATKGLPESSIGEPKLKTSSEEEPLLIRRSVRTDLPKRPIKDTTPQQDAVAIALTKDSSPRTPKNISDETGIPQPSVRRTMSELEKKSTTDQERVPVRITDEIPVKQADKLAKDQYEFAGESIRQPEAVHRDFGYDKPPEGNISPEQSSQIDTPATASEPPIKQTPNFVNPFEKRESTLAPEQTIADDRPPRQPSPNIDLSRFPEEAAQEQSKLSTREPDDVLYDIARNKQNMGRDFPSGNKAEFLALNEQGQPMYNIVEKDGTRSTFTGDSELKKRNIEVPETPKDAVPMRGSELRDKILANRKIGEAWKPPSYAKAVEEKSIEGEKPFESGSFSKYEEGQKFADQPSAEKSLKSSEEGITELHGGLGGIKPSSRVLEPNSGPYGRALDSLFQSMGKIKEARVEQDIINKTEQARRFAKFSGVKDEGVIGAAKQLSTLKGEFEKVDLDKLQMTQPQVDSLFTAVKRAKITDGERARGYTALFKLFNGEGVPQRNELAILDEVFGNGFADKITEMHGGLGAVGIKVAKVANTMKSMQNSMSLAAPLRHGIGLAYRAEFRPAFVDMFKFFANKDYYDAGMKAIVDGPNYILKREAGLFTAKPGSLLNSEEEFLNSYAGDIPVVREAVGASQRGYVGFLNKLRDDTSESMLKRAEELGVKIKDVTETTNKSGEVTRVEIPTKETKAIMRFVNVFSGRGELPFGLEKMINELNVALWSPRMIASRIQIFTSPKLYMDLPKGMRLEGLKSLLAIASLGTMIDTALAYAGAKVSYNLLSTDAGKSRFGKKVIDPWGGLQQYVVGAARFLAGKTDSKTPTSRLEIAGRFLANKESPAASLAHTLLTAKKFDKADPNNPLAFGNFTTQYGQKSSIPSEIGKRFTPIFVQDIQDLMQSNPDWSNEIGLDAIMGAGSLMGMSQEYPAPQKKGLQIRKLR